jgi:extracellular elastinolytic metalloproteinase
MNSLFLLGLLGPSARVLAHPAQSAGSRHPSRSVVDLEAFRLPLTGTYVDAPAAKTNQIATIAPSGSYVETASELVKAAVPGATFRVIGDHYVGDNGVAHVNFKQTLHGIDIDNADFNINVSFYSSFIERKLFVANQTRRSAPMAVSSPSGTTSSRGRLRQQIPC